jgi:hypothetical protein
VIAQGTGQALETGRRGDADVVFVHSEAAEEAFVEEGYGVERVTVMSNDFVIVGPGEDPAGIAGGRDAVVALAAIAGSKPPSPRGATVPAPTRPSWRCGTRPASRRPASGIANSAPAWGRRSTPPPRCRPIR